MADVKPSGGGGMGKILIGLAVLAGAGIGGYFLYKKLFKGHAAPSDATSTAAAAVDNATKKTTKAATAKDAKQAAAAAASANPAPIKIGNEVA